MTVSDQSVHLVKVVQAPPEMVYRAFIDPDELVRWMHPDAFTGVSASNDPRVGGRGELIHALDGEEVGGFNWQYLEVVPGRRLVMDWQFGPAGADPDGHHSRLTIELREAGPGATEVSLTHDRLGDVPPGGPTGVSTGWTQALASLGRHFEAEGDE
ncbi:MAG TPA: SRPBCC family protein [Solirubrobacterales bacterium]|nr:SRPBCC domain-containing protein [Solirubrobacterales bacterium]HMU25924.1 SRPBCC family protein [Solirubrobacterales bacterium]HMX72010.1 SRPBCC family protein [Solirubrobacterales bacterium]HMY25275.1 SRPBCC family protein [Solirubrobacterales bacterium]HNA23776.1 SRPBCC family protein [Solirubrobacterales bacterium]